MVVAMFAVHMAVGHLFCSSSAYALHLAAKAQRLAGQRVVAVQVPFGAFDLLHIEHLRLSVGPRAFQTPAHLHAGW